jgi:hypothetical protein
LGVEAVEALGFGRRSIVSLVQIDEAATSLGMGLLGCEFGVLLEPRISVGGDRNGPVSS